MNVCTLNTNLIFMIVKNLVNDKNTCPPPPPLLCHRKPPENLTEADILESMLANEIGSNMFKSYRKLACIDFPQRFQLPFQQKF